ncbi:MAG: DUF4964 domain-containing protein, partial [Clostridia bacterium]|nr:DUF4964 domain-containing protein [Clostridia bacterium]
MKLRAPATPLITHDPYFSVWDNNHPLGETVHWTGWHNTLIGKAFIDGKEYHFLGYARYGTPSLKACGKEIDALSTTLCYANDEVKLT